METKALPRALLSDFLMLIDRESRVRQGSLEDAKKYLFAENKIKRNRISRMRTECAAHHRPDVSGTFMTSKAEEEEQ